MLLGTACAEVTCVPSTVSDLGITAASERSPANEAIACIKIRRSPRLGWACLPDEVGAVGSPPEAVCLLGYLL